MIIWRASKYLASAVKKHCIMIRHKQATSSGSIALNNCDTVFNFHKMKYILYGIIHQTFVRTTIFIRWNKSCYHVYTTKLQCLSAKAKIDQWVWPCFKYQVKSRTKAHKNGYQVGNLAIKSVKGTKSFIPWITALFWNYCW